MRITALDNYDNVLEGQTYDCNDHQALALIKKGLAKAGPVPKNKMAQPSENKENPSEVVGEDLQSSASPAAQASQQTIVQEYPGGGLVTPDQRFQQEKTEAQAKPKTVRKPRGKAATKNSSSR